MPTTAMSITKLTEAVSAGKVATVIVSYTDGFGRLQGKRMPAQVFLNHTVHHGGEVAFTDIVPPLDDETAGVGAVTASTQLALRVDLSTLHPISWVPATAFVQCDIVQSDGQAVSYVPRTVLAQRLDRADDMGFSATIATHLDFTMADDSYAQLRDGGYRLPDAAVPGAAGVAMTHGAEPVIRDMMIHLGNAGISIDGIHHREAGRYTLELAAAPALTAADQQQLAKLAVKEIAAFHSKSVTFMAAPTTAGRNQCRYRLQLQGPKRQNAFTPTSKKAAPVTDIASSFIAGVIATMRELTLLAAPNINSYKGFTDANHGKRRVAWGIAHPECALQLLDIAGSTHLESNWCGSDVNPYLGISALVAAGLWGIEVGHHGEQPVTGHPSDSEKPLLPHSLWHARELLGHSIQAKQIFGDAVIDYYCRIADYQSQAFSLQVTDWELASGFEAS